MKKILSIVFTFIIVFTLTACNKNEEVVSKNISINVYDKDENLIYNSDMSTSSEYLFDVIKENDALKLKYEDSEYGEYITSMMGIDQGDGYYWNYYINSEYATTGVSNCVIEDNTVYDFKLEKYE